MKSPEKLQLIYAFNRLSFTQKQTIHKHNTHHAVCQWIGKCEVRTPIRRVTEEQYYVSECCSHVYVSMQPRPPVWRDAEPVGIIH